MMTSSYLTWTTTLMLSLVYRSSEGTSHKSAGIDEVSICPPLVTRRPSHERLERPPPCGCTTSECDGLMCDSVVSTTAQDQNVITHYTVEQVLGDCIKTQESPKAQHSNKSSVQGHGCPLSGQHPTNNRPIGNNWQYSQLPL